MRVWIDILHTPQLNFYKAFIQRLSEEGHDVHVTVLDRGRLAKIAERELAPIRNVNVDVIGKHRMKKLWVILETNLLRYVQLLLWKSGKKIDVAFSNGAQCGVICKLFGVPEFSFDDDPQSLDYKLKEKVGIKNFSCLYQMPEGKSLPSFDTLLPALKEWAYLNPRSFTPDPEVLKDYGLEPYSYIFVREVSVGTINYSGQAPDSVLQIADKFPEGIPVVLSLEKKDKKNLYPSSWILLQEPLKDIHSLIYFSRGLVSSGDSMAREAALLGVPSYYLGVRYDMPANASAAKVARLDNRKSKEISAWMDEILSESGDAKRRQIDLRKRVDSEFVDINDFMANLMAGETKK
ncbi:MAG: DUF354 domain-containing protein [Bacteroidales bacterium]|nr:DUF354 domain-containing protein [Bacteroidales bacterium]